MSENDRVKIDLKTGEGLIIDKPGLITKLRRVSEWTYNLLAWAFWLFLLRPLVILALWYLGVRLAYHQMVFLEGFDNPQFFAFGSLSIIFIFTIAFAWNRYNLIRFKGLDRRKPPGNCTEEDLAKHYKISPKDVESFQAAPYVEIAFFGDESIELNAGAQKTKALYAPQDLAKHLKS